MVRTRIAPSPTGDPHVGTAYVALVNYCFAKRNGGQFILRMEDTDRARSTPESERAILEALHWCGLSWDEGPDVGGPFGPYRQSERSEIYAKYAAELLAGGNAFKCFCTPDRLEEMRVAQRAAGKPSRYDGLCLTLSAQEVADKEAAGETHVVRLRVPDEGVCQVHDVRRGVIEFDWSTVDMQVLIKSDGMPTYHLANVVDDHLMQITHVLRGEEWVSSAPKHLLLYRYLGWEPPVLLHLPLLRNPDKSKLSKRKNPTGILFYRAMGYLPEALMNFLGLLSNPSREGEPEILDLQQMIDRFELENVPIGGPIFDAAKLDWIDGRYLRERLTPADFAGRVASWAGAASERWSRIAALAQPRVERLSDVAPLVAFLFAGRLDIKKESFQSAKLDETELRRVLTMAMFALDKLPEWELGAIEYTIDRVASFLGRKPREIARPLYIAVTGSPTSIPLYDSMELLGRDMTRQRLRGALEAIGAPGKRDLDKWLEAYEKAVSMFPQVEGGV